MAQSQIAAELPGVAGIPRSLSDRPLHYRTWIHTWRFIRQKPLGAFGAFLILMVLFAAAFQDQISRYSPEQIFKAPNPQYDAALAERAKDDPLLRFTVKDFEKKVNPDGPLLLDTPSGAHWLGRTTSAATSTRASSTARARPCTSASAPPPSPSSSGSSSA